MKDLMIDLETLGTHNPVILTVSMVQFDLITGEVGSEFHMRLNDQNTQIKRGLEVDIGTVKWWSNQTKAAKDYAFEGMGTNSIDFGHYLYKFLFDNFSPINNEWPKVACKLWGYGSFSDNAWFHNFLDKMNVNTPILFRNNVCMRTIMNQVDKDKIFKETPFEGTKHYGVDDCKHQIKLLHKAYKELKGGRCE